MVHELSWQQFLTAQFIRLAITMGVLYFEWHSLKNSTSRAGSKTDLGESFKDLVVWQRAIQLTVAVYKLTSSFPASERFGLTNQLQRASVSVASNIAEGYGRSTKGEYVLFLGHARGSNCEVQTQLVIAEALGFGSEQARSSATGLSEEVSRMLVAIMNKLRK